MIPLVNLQKSNSPFKQEINAAIQEVITNTQFVGGPAIELLEKGLSDFTGSHAIPCANGSDALLIALMASGVTTGDEVITTPFTFIATAEMIALIGAIPVFVDIDPLTYTIDPDKITAAITNKTRAILPVSLFGHPADMKKINEIADTHTLTVIEDAAQSIGATYDKKASGNISPFAATSFYPTKPLGCYGNGGAVFCQDMEHAEYVRSLINHGHSGGYNHSIVGLNSRINSIQAAVLNVKLKYFSQELEYRRSIASRYTQNLEGILSIPHIRDSVDSSWAQYTIRHAKRDLFKDALTTLGVTSAIYYPIPIHLQKAFEYLNYKKGDFPIAERAASEVLSLPIGSHLSNHEIETVIHSCITASKNVN